MTAQNTFRPVTSQDIIELANKRADDTLTNGRTPYHPRFPDRPDDVVRHTSLHVGVPMPVALLLTRLLRHELVRIGVNLEDYRFLQPWEWHATYGWKRPGANPAEDQHRIDEAASIVEPLQRLASRMQRQIFTVTGLVVLDRQLMFTYDAHTWNHSFRDMVAVRNAVPVVAEGAYNMHYAPIDGGQILQSTAAMSLLKGPADKLVHGLRHWLPGGDFPPVSFVGGQLMLVVHRFSPMDILRKEANLMVAPLSPRPGLYDLAAALNDSTLSLASA